jgi:hypothetical protein
VLDRYREAGIDRSVLFVFPGSESDTIAQLDQYAGLLG